MDVPKGIIIHIGIKYADDLFLRICPVGGAKGASPGESTQRCNATVVIVLRFQAEAQPDLTGNWLLRLQCQHQFDRFAAEQALAIEFSFIEEELKEPRIILDGGGETGATGVIAAV